MAAKERKNWSQSMSVGNISSNLSETRRNKQTTPRNGVILGKGKEKSTKSQHSTENLIKQIHLLVMGKEAPGSSSVTCAREIIRGIQECSGKIQETGHESTDTNSFLNLVDQILEENGNLKRQLETKEAGYETMKAFYIEKLREEKNEVQMKILDLESEKQDHEDLKRRNNNLQSRLTDYENRISNNQRDIRSLEEDKERLKDEKLGLEKKNQKLKEASFEQMNKIAKLETENQELMENYYQHEKSNGIHKEKHWKLKTENWLKSNPLEYSDLNGEDDESKRPASGTSVGAITSVSRSASKYLHRPKSSHSLGLSFANSISSTVKYLDRPHSGESTNFSCANTETSILTKYSRKGDRKLKRTVSGITNISFANSDIY